MKILQINKFFFLMGGSERVMFEEARLLKNQGHTIHHFAMAHPWNYPSDDSMYFVSNIDYRANSTLYKMKMLPQTVGKTVYSLESRSKLRRLLNDQKIDIAHVHMISHQISPSIVPLLRDYGIATVQTTHEYKLVCPAYHLYIHHKNEICERCLGGRYYNAIRHRCLKNSLGASVLAAVAQYIHKHFQYYENNVDLFIAPSKFLANKLKKGGVPKEKVRYLHNSLDLKGYEPNFRVGDYAVFLGRLQPEKGLKTLIQAIALVPNFHLLIVGEGEQREELEKYVADKSVNNVTFVGYKRGDELKNLIRDSAFLVLPSEWYENCAMVTLEAYALGKPMIASRIGGIPESIDEEETGLLFEPGNAFELAEKIQILAGDKKRCEDMGRCGRAKIEQISAEHYDRLMELYEEARRKH